MTVRTLALELEFAGVVLPIALNEAGEQIVPLKPITDVFGLDWKGQYRRAQVPDFRDYWGVCTYSMSHAGQQREMVCILLNRVIAFLHSVSPSSVRAAGNEAGATFLTRKWREWGDVMSIYEQHRQGALSNLTPADVVHTSRRTRNLLAVMREKRAAPSDADRALLAALTQRMAADLGLPHQSELPMGASAT